MHHGSVVLVDFGSQYTQLIARRIREAGVLSKVVYPDTDFREIQEMSPKGIILSGGPHSAYSEDAIHKTHEVLQLKVPILGICYGMQMLAHEFGAEVIQGEKAEYGRSILKVTNQSPLFKGIPKEAFPVWMSHGDRLDSVPEGFEIVAESDNSPIACMQHTEQSLYAIQFHPEVTHTEFGEQIIQNFLFEICQAVPDWQPNDIINEIVQDIQEQVRGEKVILALSGGVDSSVAAVLLNKAIGTQLICIFIDTGLLRLNEADEVMRSFKTIGNLNVIRVDASARFLKALQGKTDPEQKRKCIGNLFIEIFEEEAQKLEGIQFLAQGTIYPDVIESAGSKHAKVIKSHHNVGGLPEKMQLKLIEPLRNLFKDEVRRVGEAMGMPHQMVFRHPFPGPGLAVRMLGEVKEEYLDILRKADAIFIALLREKGFYESTAQAFAVFMPVSSVGVIGDNRQYGYVIALRAVKTTDYMTADWADLPHDFLAEVSSRIINEVPAVSRVVYDISSKPPATIEWE